MQILIFRFLLQIKCQILVYFLPGLRRGGGGGVPTLLYVPLLPMLPVRFGIFQQLFTTVLLSLTVKQNDFKQSKALELRNINNEYYNYNSK